MSTIQVTNKLPPEVSRTYPSRVNRVEQQTAQQAQSPEAPTRDEVLLSPDAHIIEKAKAVAAAPLPQRTERLEELKRQIAQGAYQVPVEALVDRLLRGESVADEG